MIGIEREFLTKLNRLLIDIYSNIEKIEAQALKKHGEGNLSISEFHIIEAIAENGEDGATVGEISQRLSVTYPTVTVAISKLEKKECVTRVQSSQDGRVVRVVLTRLGRRMNAMHRYFHERLVMEMCRGQGEDDLNLLMNSFDKLNSFLSGYTNTELKDKSGGDNNIYTGNGEDKCQ